MSVRLSSASVFVSVSVAVSVAVAVFVSVSEGFPLTGDGRKSGKQKQNSQPPGNPSSGSFYCPEKCMTNACHRCHGIRIPILPLHLLLLLIPIRHGRKKCATPPLLISTHGIASVWLFVLLSHLFLFAHRAMMPCSSQLD